MEVFQKTKEAKLDYGFNWSRWLATNETIVSSNWVISGDGQLTKVLDQVASPTTVIYLDGGTSGRNYTVTNTVVTDSTPIAREESRMFRIKIGAR